MSKGYSAKWIISADGNLYEDSTLITDEGKVILDLAGSKNSEHI